MLNREKTKARSHWKTVVAVLVAKLQTKGSRSSRRFALPPSGLTGVSNPTNLQNTTFLLVVLTERNHLLRVWAAVAVLLEVNSLLVELLMENKLDDTTR